MLNAYPKAKKFERYGFCMDDVFAHTSGNRGKSCTVKSVEKQFCSQQSDLHGFGAARIHAPSSSVWSLPIRMPIDADPCKCGSSCFPGFFWIRTAHDILPFSSADATAFLKFSLNLPLVFCEIEDIYPLVIKHSCGKIHHATNGKIHYFNGHFPVRKLLVITRLGISHKIP